MNFLQNIKLIFKVGDKLFQVNVSFRKMDKFKAKLQEIKPVSQSTARCNRLG